MSAVLINLPIVILWNEVCLLNKLSEQSYWDKHWVDETKTANEEYLFNSFLLQYLPSQGTYFEIGCAPGKTMVNFAKNFGYQVSGVDFSSLEITRETLRQNGIHDAAVYDADFTTFQLEEKFDVVSSYGFIEHFDDYNAIIKKQASFVKEGGHIVVQLPNIRYFNYCLYRIFDPDLIKIHNPNAMRPDAIRGPLLELGCFEILYCNYYFTCFLYFDSNNPEISQRPFRKAVFKLSKQLLSTIGLGNIPNKWFSPYIILVAKRDKGTKE